MDVVEDEDFLEVAVVEDVDDVRGRGARATPYATATESALATHNARRLVPGNR